MEYRVAYAIFSEEGMCGNITMNMTGSSNLAFHAILEIMEAVKDEAYETDSNWMIRIFDGKTRHITFEGSLAEWSGGEYMRTMVTDAGEETDVTAHEDEFLSLWL